MTYRLLTKEEISLLISQGCFADNWTDISVREGFSCHEYQEYPF